MSEFYGIVKLLSNGEVHLVRGQADHTLCGLERPGIVWPWVARGIVPREKAREVSDCDGCIMQAEAS